MKKLLVLVLLSCMVSAYSLDEARESFLNATLDVKQAEREGLPYESLEDTLQLMDERLNGRDADELFKLAVLLNSSDDGSGLAKVYFDQIEEAKRTNGSPGQNFTFVVEKAGWISERKS